MQYFYLLIGLLLPVISFAQIEINCEEAQLNFLEYLTIDGLVFSRDESSAFSYNLEKLNEVGLCYFSVNDSLINNYNIPPHILQKYPGAMMLHFLIFRPKNQMDQIDKFINHQSDSRKDTVQNILGEYMCKKYVRKRVFVKEYFKAIVQQETDLTFSDDKTFNLLVEDSIYENITDDFGNVIETNVLKQEIKIITSSVIDTANYKLVNLYTDEISKGSNYYELADKYIRYLFQGETKNIVFVQNEHPVYFTNCYLFALNHFYSNERDIDALNSLLDLNFKIDVADSINNEIESKKHFYKYALCTSEFQYSDACKFYLKYYNNFEDINITRLSSLSSYLFRYSIFSCVPECNDCELTLKGFIISNYNKNKESILHNFNFETQTEYLILEFVKLFTTDTEIISIVDEILVEVNKKENINRFVFNNKNKWYQFLNYDYWIGPASEGETLWVNDFLVQDKLYSQLKNDILLFAESQGINKNSSFINPMLVEYCTYQLIASYLYNKDNNNQKNSRYIISQLEKECFDDKNSIAYHYIEKEMLHVIKFKYFPDLLLNKQIVDTIPPVIIINQTSEIATNSNYEISGFVIDMSVVNSFALNGISLIIDSKNRAFKYNIALSEGINILRFRAEDVYGNSSTTDRTIIYQPIKDEFSVRKNYALLFAVNDYDEDTGWPDLMNPIADAEKLAKELVKYGFDTLIIRNPTQKEVLQNIYWYAQKQYGKYDQLLIFYSGHGEFDEVQRVGSLALSDSKQSDPFNSSYISYADISERLDNNKCRHILFISDACYSGTFFKSVACKGKKKYFDFTPALIKEKLEYKTRLFLGSAGKEESPGESVFIAALLNVLRSTNSKKEVLTFIDILPYLQTLKPQPTNGQFGTNEPSSTFIFERIFDK